MLDTARPLVTPERSINPGPEQATAFASPDPTVRPLAGCSSGETFLVEAADHVGVIRFYGSRPERAGVDHSLLRLVRGLIPVPEVLEARTAPGRADRDDRAAPAPYVLCERLPGVRLDLVLADDATNERVRRTAGGHLGDLLARLSGMPFLRRGEFTGPGLAVREVIEQDPTDWITQRRGQGRFASWNDSEIDGLSEVAVQAQALLDDCSRVCLCHNDIDPSNVLVDPDTGRITGLLDWERAYAGAPHTDLGRLLRFETDEVFCSAVLRSYADRAPNVRSDFLDRARAADLFALVELLAEPTGADSAVDSAEALVRRIATSREIAGGRAAWSGAGPREQM